MMPQGMKFYGIGYYNITEYNYINTYGLYPEEYKDILKQSSDYAKNWNISFDKLIDILNNLNITHNLFEFCFVGTGTSANHLCGRLLAEKVGYTEKNVYLHGAYRTVKTEYDVYVVESPYCRLALNKCGNQIMKIFYKWLYKTETYKPYADLPEGLNETSTPQTLYKNGYDSLTFGDIKNILNHPNTYKDYEVVKCVYNCYDNMVTIKVADVDIYDVHYEHTLIIPIEAIVKRDWSIVENYNVHSIIKPDANSKLGKDPNNWFKGLQKDCPYWDNEKVKEIEKNFKEQN